MNPNYERPYIPKKFQEQWEGDEFLRLTHEELASLSHQRFADGLMPELPLKEHMGVSYVDILPKGADAESAIVVPHAFAMGWGTDYPQMAAMGLMISAAARDKRTVIFPASTRSTPGPALDKEQRRGLVKGDFKPYAQQMYGVLEALDVTSAHVVGYSQGASTGAALMWYMTHTEGISLQDSAILEAPNVGFRSRRQMFLDFVEDSQVDVAQAQKDACIPFMSQPLPQTKLQAARGAVGYLRDAFMTNNQCIARGFCTNTLVKDLEPALENSDARLLLARGTHSTVMSDQSMNELTRQLQSVEAQVKTVEVPQYGHAFGNNAPLLGLLASMAIKR